MKKLLLKKFIMIGVLCLGLLMLGMSAFDVRLKVQEYTVEADNILAPVRIVLIADLHCCSYGEGQKDLIDAIDEQEPDLVLFAGDIFDDRIPHENSELVVAAVGDKYPSFYVAGNHEYRSGEVETIKEMLRSYGVTVLEGDCEKLDIGGQEINICGIDDPEAGEDVVLAQLEACEKRADNGFYSLLLTHRPEYIDTYLEYDFDLILSGHAHGGQWRIPGLINGLLAPNQGWFPQYAGGKYQFDEATMIVSRGLARESTRLPRIFNRPELVVIELLPLHDVDN